MSKYKDILHLEVNLRIVCGVVHVCAWTGEVGELTKENEIT